VDGVFDLIAAALKSGDEVRLTGFGVFVVATRAGGKGRNPQTGEEITIKPSSSRAGRASSSGFVEYLDRGQAHRRAWVRG
jgi:nucleoid DNA-binding protein